MTSKIFKIVQILETCICRMRTHPLQSHPANRQTGSINLLLIQFSSFGQQAAVFPPPVGALICFLVLLNHLLDIFYLAEPQQQPFNVLA